MNFNKRVNGSWTDVPHYISGTDTETITTLPATIYPLAQSVTIGLKGNTVQNGTPTPDNPVMPNGTGERTANLFDKSATDTTQGYVDNYYLLSTGNTASNAYLAVSIYIPVLNSTSYTLSFGRDLGNTPALCLYDINKAYITGYSYSGRPTITFTTTANTAYVRLSVNKTYSGNFMLVEGSTAPTSYIPYGYKIPISINNVVTDIYIGDNPLRKSLDGTAYDTLAADGTLTRRVDSDGSVLPTPIVTQVTMPTFTTTPGANTLDVLTTVPPSEVTATFNGWHPVSSAHERDNGAWT